MGAAGGAPCGARAGAIAFVAGIEARASPVRAFEAPAVSSFAVDRPFAAATGFFVPVPDFEDRAAAPGPAVFVPAAFREEAPFAEGFLVTAGFSAAASPVRAFEAPAVAAFAADRPFAAATGFFVPVPDFEDRAAAPGPAVFVPAAFREEAPFAAGFLVTAGFSAAASSVRAFEAPAVAAFAVDRPFAAATGFFVPVPDFEDRAAAPGPAVFVPAAFREEAPFAAGFLVTAGFSAAASPVRAFEAPAVSSFAVDRPFAAATGFFVPVPDFEDRAAAPGPAVFVPAAFREEAPFAAGFLVTAGFSAAASSVARAAAASAAVSLPRVRARTLRLVGSVVLPVVATVVSEGIGAFERRRGK